MIKKCSTCGAPAPDRMAVFCNRCGSRLPAAPEAEVLTCEVCKKAVTDRQSRFCDRCGSPLAPALPAVSPAPPAVQRRNCPACGFGNFGENLFYCRKCGAILPKYESVQKNRPGARAPSGRPLHAGISIIPDGMDEFRQQPVNAPVGARQPSVDAPVALRRPPAPAKTETLIPPSEPRLEVPKKRDTGSCRKVAIIAAVIILLLLIVAAIVLVAPGLLNAGPANTTDENTTMGDTTDEDSIDEDTTDEDTIDEHPIDEDSTIGDTTDPGLFGALSGVIIPGQKPVIRQAPPGQWEQSGIFR